MSEREGKNSCTASNGIAVAQTTMPTVHVAALTEGVLKAMLLAKLRIPLMVVVALARAGTGVARREPDPPAGCGEYPWHRYFA